VISVAVSDKFSLSRGEVQNLMNSASSFAASVLQFCKEIQEFWAYQVLVYALKIVPEDASSGGSKMFKICFDKGSLAEVYPSLLTSVNLSFSALLPST